MELFKFVAICFDKLPMSRPRMKILQPVVSSDSRGMLGLLRVDSNDGRGVLKPFVVHTTRTNDDTHERCLNRMADDGR